MGLIPEDVISRIIEKSDIVDTISSYIPLKKAGRNFKACCPFHSEQTPSFVVNPDKQIFHCFGCAVGGNVISFVMKHDHLEFPEAIRLMANKAGIEIPEDRPENTQAQGLRQALLKINGLAVNYFQDLLLLDKSAGANYAREYLKSRGVTLETAKKFQIGYALDQWEGLIQHLKKNNVEPSLIEQSGLVVSRDDNKGYYDRFRNRIIFPIFDNRQQCRAFGARALEETGAKYINSPETKVYTKGEHVYGFNIAKESVGKLDQVVVVEGYTDCILPYQEGLTNFVASCGTALTVEQIRSIRRYTKNIVLLFDSDSAGQAAMVRSLETLLEEGMHVKVASLNKDEDPDSFVRTFGADALRKRISEALSVYEFQLKKLQENYDANSAEGKAQIASSMMRLIAKFDHAVIRSEYLQRLASDLSIDLKALNEENQKIDSKQGSSENFKNVVSKEFTPQVESKAERHILRLLLNEERFVAPTKDEFQIEDFQDSQVRYVMSKVYDLFDQGQGIDIGQLLESFDNQDVKQFLTGIAASEEPLALDKEKMHRDLMCRMKKDKIKSKTKLLRAEIQQAETKGDQHLLKKLKQEFMELMSS